jgi:hypothetical protein
LVVASPPQEESKESLEILKRSPSIPLKKGEEEIENLSLFRKIE